MGSGGLPSQQRAALLGGLHACISSMQQDSRLDLVEVGWFYKRLEPRLNDRKTYEANNLIRVGHRLDQ